MSLIYRLVSWLREEKAQTMAEYGLILALVSIVAILALFTLGGQIGDVFGDITTALTGAVS